MSETDRDNGAVADKKMMSNHKNTVLHCKRNHGQTTQNVVCSFEYSGSMTDRSVPRALEMRLQKEFRAMERHHAKVVPVPVDTTSKIVYKIQCRTPHGRCLTFEITGQYPFVAPVVRRNGRLYTSLDQDQRLLQQYQKTYQACGCLCCDLTGSTGRNWSPALTIERMYTDIVVSEARWHRVLKDHVSSCILSRRLCGQAELPNELLDVIAEYV